MGREIETIDQCPDLQIFNEFRQRLRLIFRQYWIYFIYIVRLLKSKVNIGSLHTKSWWILRISVLRNVRANSEHLARQLNIMNIYLSNRFNVKRKTCNFMRNTFISFPSSWNYIAFHLKTLHGVQITMVDSLINFLIFQVSRIFIQLCQGRCRWNWFWSQHRDQQI